MPAVVVAVHIKSCVKLVKAVGTLSNRSENILFNAPRWPLK